MFNCERAHDRMGTCLFVLPAGQGGAAGGGLLGAGGGLRGSSDRPSQKVYERMLKPGVELGKIIAAISEPANASHDGACACVRVCSWVFVSVCGAHKAPAPQPIVAMLRLTHMPLRLPNNN
jgi:hypothetical protein